jgi:hypothetical protein
MNLTGIPPRSIPAGYPQRWRGRFAPANQRVKTDAPSGHRLPAAPLAIMEIRRATPEDAEAISALIKSVAHYFTLHPQGLGAEAFLQSIEPEAIRGYITAPNFL